jgi:hypothetical protein
MIKPLTNLLKAKTEFVDDSPTDQYQLEFAELALTGLDVRIR